MKASSASGGIGVGLLIAAAIYVEYWLYLGTRVAPPPGGVAIVGAVAVFAGTLVLALRGPRALAARLSQFGLPLLPVVGWMVLSLWWSADTAYGGEKLLIAGAKGLAPAFLIAAVIGTERQWRLMPVLWFGIAGAVLVLIEGGPSLEYPGRWTLEGMNPIWLGRLGWLTVALAIAARREPLLPRVIAGVAGAAVGLVTASRGPMLAFLAALLLWYLWIDQRSTRVRESVARRVLRTLGWGTAVAAIATAVLMGDGQSVMPERLRFGALGSDANVLARIDAQKAALDEFGRHPLIGVGAGSLAVLTDMPYPHSVPIEIAAEYGGVGLLLAGLALWHAWSRARNAPPLRLFLLMALLFSTTSGDLGGNWMVVLAIGIALMRPVITGPRVADPNGGPP